MSSTSAWPSTVFGEVADIARIGDLVIVDAQLPYERRQRWRWAA